MSYQTKNMEPLARGLPVVTTRLAAMGLHREPAAGHNHTGVFIVPAHPRLVADQVVQLLSNATLWQQASEGASAFIGAHFLPHALEAEISELLMTDGSPDPASRSMDWYKTAL